MSIEILTINPENNSIEHIEVFSEEEYSDAKDFFMAEREACARFTGQKVEWRLVH